MLCKAMAQEKTFNPRSIGPLTSFRPVNGSQNNYKGVGYMAVQGEKFALFQAACWAGSY